jgi:nucleoside-diphosphate-sugar epimerase
MDQLLVLVTGATGFVAKHCIAELLRHGYRVRGTARDVERGIVGLRGALGNAGVDASRVELVSADLERDAGWDAAVAGCSHVLHVASPFPIEQPKDREAVVRPARDGALRVLRAATRASVKRVVMTSSTVAIMYTAENRPGHVYSEADWSDPARPDLTPYMVSKTVAERAAWDYVRATADAPELCCINPGFVQGPALDADLSTSLEVQRLMGKGAYPGAPSISFPIADVRDIAALHVIAMTHPAAAGERFLAANGTSSLMGIGRIIATALPDLKSKVPRFELPDLVVRGLAKIDRRLAAVLPELGATRNCSNAKTREQLGFAFRSADDAIRDGAISLRRLGII